jgi:energy-coupling factor transport system ATP-binding protein
MIEFRDAGFAYEAGRSVLSEVSLRVEPGRIVAVAGPNGSGKSTLALLADGLLLPTSGSVWVDGMDTAEESTVWEVRSRVGLVFQNPDDQIVGALAEEDAAFGPENLGVAPEEIAERVARSLAAVGLTGLERREPHLLSEGQKQRLAVAGVLAMGVPYVVFDEPTALLDPVGRREFAGIIRGLARDDGRGVMLVTHRPSEIALADDVVVLGNGSIAWRGQPYELLADASLMASLDLGESPVGALAADLRARGRDVPATAQDAETLVAALWA